MKVRKALLPNPLYLLIVYCLVNSSRGQTKFEDDLVDSTQTLTLDNSPYLISKDVLVSPSGKLVIEPGVEVRFRPEVGITVRGVLKAIGTRTQKIRFVPDRTIPAIQPNRTIRLVDGPDVNEGIVQVLESGSWRSVCTNSRNWTQADLHVACRQLGFTGGEWHHWYPHLNDTRQILYQDPGKSRILNKSKTLSLKRFHRDRFSLDSPKLNSLSEML